MHPGPPTPARSSLRLAFVQVCNLRSIALVYYLCLAMALSVALGWYGYGVNESLQVWLHSLLRMTRQCLIIGLLLLFAIALAEAVLAALPAWSAGRRLLLRGLVLLLAAGGGMWLRFEVGNWGNPTARLGAAWAWSTTLLWGLLGAVGWAALLTARAERQAQRALVQAAREHDQLQTQQLEAQLSALTAQIEPHFLFNTLAHVKRLYETRPEHGRQMLQSLMAYLRAALPGMRRSESTLAQELDLVRSYLSILQMRMGERLRFDIDSPAELAACRLPTLVLPTLVENAIKHGLAPLPEGGHVGVLARREGAQLCIEVSDSGRGFGGASGGTGVGLANTRARLAALFGPAAELELEARSPQGVLARLRLPLEAAS
jgi:two-component sensor histidine kinase